MGTRTIQLSQDAEAQLTALQEITGGSVSEIVSRGLDMYAASITDVAPERPYDIYRRMDLGPGGYAVGSAAQSDDVVAEVIQQWLRPQK